MSKLSPHLLTEIYKLVQRVKHLGIVPSFFECRPDHRHFGLILGVLVCQLGTMAHLHSCLCCVGNRIPRKWQR